MSKLDTKIDFIFFKEIGFPLDGEEINYIVVKHDDEYIVKAINGKSDHVYKMVNFIAYDYNKLSIYNQIRYEKIVHSIEKVDDNIYRNCEKKLSKHNNLFT